MSLLHMLPRIHVRATQGMQVAVIKARPTKPTESQQKLFARDEAVYETECV